MTNNIPKHWQIKKLGEVCDIQNGYAFKSKDYVDDGFRVIRIGNVQNGEIIDKRPKFISVKKAKDNKDFISKLSSCTQRDYLSAQKEALLLLEWVKRYAQAFLK